MGTDAAAKKYGTGGDDGNAPDCIGYEGVRDGDGNATDDVVRGLNEPSALGDASRHLLDGASVADSGVVIVAVRTGATAATYGTGGDDGNATNATGGVRCGAAGDDGVESGDAREVKTGDDASVSAGLACEVTEDDDGSVPDVIASGAIGEDDGE